MYYNKKDLFEKFYENRSFLISKLDKKELDKSSFIVENYNFFMKIGAMPFVKMDSMDKALFNYQYYNIMAKYYKNRAIEIEKRGKKTKLSISCRNKSLDQYNKKNDVIIKMLDLVHYKNVDAYYIESKSKHLNGSLYEIVFKDYDKAIFHSTEKKILDKLTLNYCFTDVIKKSVIDDYINSKYEF